MTSIPLALALVASLAASCAAQRFIQETAALTAQTAALPPPLRPALRSIAATPTTWVKISYFCASHPQVEMYPLDYCIVSSYNANFIYSASAVGEAVVLAVQVFSDTSCLVPYFNTSINCSTSCGNDFARQCNVISAIEFTDAELSVVFKVFSDSECTDMVIATQQPLYQCIMTSKTSSVLVKDRNSSAFVSSLFDSDGICDGEDSTQSIYSLTPKCTQSPLYPTSFFTETYDAPSSATRDDASCFAGRATVQLEGGSLEGGSLHRLLKDVRVGDRILSADRNLKMSYSAGKTCPLRLSIRIRLTLILTCSFAAVVALPHAANDAYAEFCEITLPDSGTLLLTPEHLLLAGDCSLAKEAFALVAAKTVVPGGCVLDASARKTRVVRTARVIDRGLYTVVTGEEFVVVSGVVTSPFASNHALPHAFYSAYRMLAARLPTLFGAGAAAAGLSAFAAVIMSV